MKVITCPRWRHPGVTCKSQSEHTTPIERSHMIVVTEMEKGVFVCSQLWRVWPIASWSCCLGACRGAHYAEGVRIWANPLGNERRTKGLDYNLLWEHLPRDDLTRLGLWKILYLPPSQGPLLWQKPTSSMTDSNYSRCPTWHSAV